MRYADHLPLPPYAYVPGRAPHPISDPRGHGFVGVRFVDQEVDLERWRECATYCYGLDLFNYGFYWEAHEVWERLWQGAGRVGEIADYLKGLIKLAAALVKAREGNSVGVRRHAERAGELFRSVLRRRQAQGQSAGLGGLDLMRLSALTDQLADQAEQLVSGEIVAPFAGCQLVPQA